MSDAEPLPLLSPRRGRLAGWEHSYRVAVQRRTASGKEQFILRTGNPLQPYRVTSRLPAPSEHILALVA
ncbi:MAG: hypothetical protein ACOY4P_05405 [Pseudomonadota bacterium]|jgi:hypothetical protein